MLRTNPPQNPDREPLGRCPRRRPLRAGAAPLSLEPSRRRQAHHQLRRRQHLAKLTETDPLTRRDGRGAVGEGLGRRSRLDQARRLRDALHGQAQRDEGPLSRRRARGRDGGAAAARDLQPQSARRLDRHAAARLPALPARRPRAPRRGDRHRRIEEFAPADARTSMATRSAGCRGSGPASSSACGWKNSRARTRRRRAACSKATASSPGPTTARPATS